MEESYLREELRKKLADLTALAKDYQNLVRINKELERKIEAGLGAEERMELEEIVSNLQFENKALASDMKSNDEMIEKLEKDVKNIDKALADARSENAKLKDGKASFDKLVGEHEKVLREYENLGRELNELKFTNRELNEELNCLYQKEDGSHEESKRITEGKQKLENEIKARDEKLKNVENELVNVTKKLTMMQMDLDKERNQVRIYSLLLEIAPLINCYILL